LALDEKRNRGEGKEEKMKEKKIKESYAPQAVKA
jgi:hypothetical protein